MARLQSLIVVTPIKHTPGEGFSLVSDDQIEQLKIVLKERIGEQAPIIFSDVTLCALKTAAHISEFFGVDFVPDECLGTDGSHKPYP